MPKNKKHVGRVCSSQDWSQKNSQQKINLFLEKALLEQTPPNSKKMSSKSEK